MDPTNPAPAAPLRPHGPDLRPLAALAISLACHVVALLILARGWSSPVGASVPLVVTMLERGGDGRAAGGAATDGVERADASTIAAVAPPPVAPPLPAAPRPRVARAAALREPTPEHAGRAPAPIAEAASVASIGGGGRDDVGAATGEAGGVAGRAAGRGSGAGDGLRVHCRDCPAPDYPSRARRQGWEGTVDVELRIAPDGSVETARVGASSGHPALDEAALASARRSRFAMPTDGGGLGGRLRYRFVLDETAARR